MTKEKEHIFLASPHMSAQGYEQEYIKEAFDTNWIAPLGKNVTEFEREMMAITGAKAAVALASGTSAIHLALRLAGVGLNDVVFCSDLTFSASANPIVYQGAKPVFIDSDEATWNMSAEALRMAFEKYAKMGIKPKAVILVHLYGMAADLEEILSICEAYDCILIEDAAESLGTTYTVKRDVTAADKTVIKAGETRKLGTFGTYGILSFNGNKIITTSGGGMLLCNGKNAQEDGKRALSMATQARMPAPWYQHQELGFNYRMSNIVAGIGRGQLKVLDERVQQKREIYQYYKNVFAGVDAVTLMPMQEHVYCNCWLSCMTVSPDSKVKAMDIIDALAADDVESRPVWKPMHLQPFFKDCDFVTQKTEPLRVIDAKTGADNSVGGTIFLYGVCLPSDTKMDAIDKKRISDVLIALF